MKVVFRFLFRNFLLKNSNYPECFLPIFSIFFFNSFISFLASPFQVSVKDFHWFSSIWSTGNWEWNLLW